MTKAQERRDAIEARKLTQYVAKVQRLLGHLVYNRTPTSLINEAYAEGKTADAYAAEVAAQEPVGAAVHALKADAVKAAGERAQRTIEHVRTELAAGGWDMQTVAPYPFGLSVWSEEYRKAKARYSLFGSLVKDDAAARNSHQMHAPRIVVMSQSGMDRFVAQAEEMAAAEYDSFICKLVSKIGDCDNASLLGSHVWDHSILTVKKGTEVECWQTKQIWNVSKLGLHFPQWPSRQVKG